MATEKQLKAMRFAYSILTDKRQINRYGGTYLASKNSPDLFGYDEMLEGLAELYEDLKAQKGAGGAEDGKEKRSEKNVL